MLHFKSGARRAAPWVRRHPGLPAGAEHLRPGELDRKLEIQMLLASRADLLDVYAKFLNWGAVRFGPALRDREHEIVESSIEVATVRRCQRAALSERDRIPGRRRGGFCGDREGLARWFCLVFAIPLASDQPAEARGGPSSGPDSGRLLPDVLAEFPAPRSIATRCLTCGLTEEDGLEARGHLELAVQPGRVVCTA